MLHLHPHVAMHASRMLSPTEAIHVHVSAAIGTIGPRLTLLQLLIPKSPGNCHRAECKFAKWKYGCPPVQAHYNINMLHCWALSLSV